MKIYTLDIAESGVKYKNQSKSIIYIRIRIVGKDKIVVSCKFQPKYKNSRCLGIYGY